jgi:hypothetical protein
MNDQNICPTCKHNGNCSHQKRMGMNIVLICASYAMNYGYKTN